METIRRIALVIVLISLSPLFLSATGSPVTNVVTVENLKKESKKIQGWRNNFNRAGVLVKQKKYGMSLLHLERAKIIYDGYSPLENNIRLIKQKTGANIFSLQVNGLIKTVFFYYFYFSKYTLINCIVIITVLLLLSLSIGFYRGFVNKLWFKTVLVSLVVLTLLFLLSLSLKMRQETERGRSIIVKEVKLYGTKDRQHSLTTLPEATEVTVEKRDGNIALVTLPGGLSGWIEYSSYCQIVDGNNSNEY